MNSLMKELHIVVYDTIGGHGPTSEFVETEDENGVSVGRFSTAEFHERLKAGDTSRSFRHIVVTKEDFE